MPNIGPLELLLVALVVGLVLAVVIAITLFAGRAGRTPDTTAPATGGEGKQEAYCQYCGSEVGADWAFCRSCGGKLGAGRGQTAIAEVPEGVGGWSWGGFMFGWLWGAFNSTWIALLTLIPIVGVVMSFVLGAKGNEWAWRNRRWDSVDHFRRVQRRWTCASFVVLIMWCGLMGIGLILALRSGGAGTAPPVEAAEQHVAEMEPGEVWQVFDRGSWRRIGRFDVRGGVLVVTVSEGKAAPWHVIELRLPNGAAQETAQLDDYDLYGGWPEAPSEIEAKVDVPNGLEVLAAEMAGKPAVPEINDILVEDDDGREWLVHESTHRLYAPDVYGTTVVWFDDHDDAIYAKDIYGSKVVRLVATQSKDLYKIVTEAVLRDDIVAWQEGPSVYAVRLRPRQMSMLGL